MQWADGEKSFKQGYRKMKEKFANDPPRLQYVHELFKDPKKALWKVTWTFCNAVVVDVCECFFNALKTWTTGSSRRSVSLLMAVVRITEGCRLMMLKPFLNLQQVTLRRLSVSGQPASVSYLIRNLVQHLTFRSLKMILDCITRCWSNYNVQVIDANTVIVTNRYTLTFHKLQNFTSY